MLDQKIEKVGTVTISENKIYISDFEVKGATCREVAIHAMLWAIGELQKDVVESISAPGAGISCID